MLLILHLTKKQGSEQGYLTDRIPVEYLMLVSMKLNVLLYFPAKQILQTSVEIQIAIEAKTSDLPPSDSSPLVILLKPSLWLRTSNSFKHFVWQNCMEDHRLSYEMQDQK